MRMLVIFSVLSLLGAMLYGLSALVLANATRGLSPHGIVKPYAVAATVLFVLFASGIGVAAARPDVRIAAAHSSVSTAPSAKGATAFVRG
jgi:hypothetical protein